MSEKTVKEILEEMYQAVARELPAPSHEIGEYKDVAVEMRDGERLMTRVFFPAGEGPWPVILVRNPYSPVNSLAHMQLPFLLFARYGYVVVYQQVRGIFDSEGTWRAFENERNDGLDTIDWIIRQEWMDGNVGTFGGSYLAHVQWSMADRLPPEVKTMYISIFGGDAYELFYKNGMFKMGCWTMWASGMMEPGPGFDDSPAEKDKQFRKALVVRPQIDMDIAMTGKSCSWYRDWISHPNPGSDYWNTGFWGMYKEIVQDVRIPVMIQSGWFDVFLEAAINTFNQLPEHTRSQSRFVISPWHHGNMPGGDLEYPHDNILGPALMTDALSWFDHHLKGAAYDKPKGEVEAYVIGEGRWRTSRGWIRPSGARIFILRKSRESNGRGGELGDHSPERMETITYRYDPENPVLSKGGNLLANYNDPEQPPECSVLQDEPGSREDVISFISPPLEEPLAIAGNIKVYLNVSSDVEDTAFTAKVMEVFPDGKAYNIQDGITTLAFRNGNVQAQQYTPGEIVGVELKLPAILWTVKRGSRIRLDVSSSNYPAYHAHPNIAGVWSLQKNVKIANQTLHLGGDHPSFIEIPFDSGAKPEVNS